MQKAPALPSTGVMRIEGSNRAQQRGAHGAFRFFGKLAPDVTGAVLDAASELTSVEAPVVDLMCGSGTTLLEASDRDWRGIGLDVNPVALLYAGVKTRPVDRARYESWLERVATAAPPDAAARRAVFATTRNADRWFSKEAQREIARLRTAIEGLPSSPERDALFAVLLSRLRRASNGSARTGRLFFDPDSAVPVVEDFQRAAEELVDYLPDHSLPIELHQADARATQLADGSTDLSFCHPPYFALYRFSADVLRFELEIGGFSRRGINQHEIREGWKSGDSGNLDLYVSDMGAVFVEARRVTKPDGVLALVVSNSTLGDAQLPVVDRLAEAAERVGWRVAEHLIRPMHHGSASYHRSARTDKVVQQDHVLLFT